MYNILICDDEKDIVSALEIYLRTDGYKTFSAANGTEALEILSQEEIHLVLMDIMMPVMDGLTATSRLREKYNVPVILLTAKGEDADKVLGLNMGADDYVTKPFHPAELSARVRSQLRRYTTLGGARQEDEIRLGGIVLSERSRAVTLDGDPLSLTPTEYEILRLLMSHPGQILSPKEIYRRVWNDQPYGAESTVAVHVRHLREKIEIDPASPRYLRVVWGHGYVMGESKNGGEKQ